MPSVDVISLIVIIGYIVYVYVTLVMRVNEIKTKPCKSKSKLNADIEW